VSSDSDLVVVSEVNADFDHLVRNERATSALRRIERLTEADHRTDGVEAVGGDVYGDAEIRGWDPVLETFTDVPPRYRPGDFETVERQILDPNT
jgi:hypothetical protein